jgi:hypothetical protein
MAVNHAYKRARRWFGPSAGLKSFFRHAAVRSIQSHPWAAAIALVSAGFLLAIQPGAVWVAGVVALTCAFVYKADYRAALGTAMVGVLMPLAVQVVNIIAAVLPVLFVGGVVAFYLYWAGNPPKLDLSDSTRSKLASLRRPPR